MFPFIFFLHVFKSHIFHNICKQVQHLEANCGYFELFSVESQSGFVPVLCVSSKYFFLFQMIPTGDVAVDKPNTVSHSVNPLCAYFMDVLTSSAYFSAFI